METRTKVILGVALVVAAGMMLFPPERGGGYEFIFDARSVDGAKVLVQMGLLGAFVVTINFVVGWIMQPGPSGAIKKTARYAVLLAALLVALTIAAMAGRVAFAYATQVMPEKMLSLRATYNPSYCSDEHPMLVSVSNKWFGRFREIGFTIQMYDRSGNQISASWQGTTEELASAHNFDIKEALDSGYSYQEVRNFLLADIQYVWDTEIPSWHSDTGCYAHPNSLVLHDHNPRDLAYTVVIHEIKRIP